MGPQLFADALLVLAATGVAAGFVVRLVRRVRETEQRLARLERLTMTDDVTGLPNRRLWEEQLPRELGRALRYEEAICVAMLDIDPFGEYSEAYGHQAADRLLKEVASAWRAVRPYDLLARYNGKELSLILAGCRLEDAMGIVDRLRDATPDAVSCSAGVAEWDRDEYPDSFVDRADAALDDAKRSGRDQTVCSHAVH
jgi:diguanylate cyclase (GGDEF)-like protein